MGIDKVILPPPPKVPLECKVQEMGAWIEEHKLVKESPEGRVEKLELQVRILQIVIASLIAAKIAALIFA